MNNLKFKVWCEKENTMYSDGFVLDQQGGLYQIKKAELNEMSRIVPVNANEYVVLHSLDREDISGRIVYEGDILRYETGYEFVVNYGEHPAYCSGDRAWTTNEGFFAVLFDENLNYDEINLDSVSYPLSDIEHSALVVGNIFQGYFESDPSAET